MASEEVRVKNEPICDSQSISQTKKANKVKEEPIDIEMQTSKSHIKSMSEEVELKAEEKFSASEEFTKKTSIQTVSIAFFNEETNSNQATTSKSQSIVSQNSK